MVRSNSMVVMMLFMMVGAFQLQSAVAQTRMSNMQFITHVVGGALGWTVPPNGAAFYTVWASEQTFRVGDTLVFNFTNGVHNVAEVSQEAYGPCTKTNVIATTTNGSATLTLFTSGKHYYVCTVGTHCRIGQKLTINVAPRIATNSAPVGTMMPSSPTTPLPTPPSRATTSAAVVPFIFLWVCLLTLIDY